MAKYKIAFAFLLLGLLVVPSFAIENPEQKLTRLIENYVVYKHPEWAGLKVQVTFKGADKIFDSLSRIEGECNLKVAEKFEDFKPVGTVILPVEVTSDTINERVFIRANVSVMKPIVVTVKQIKKGAIIEVSDLTLEERDISMLPNTYVDAVEKVAGKEAATAMQQNRTILAWMIKDVPQVRRGSEVTILVIDDNLAVRTKGMVLEDGYLNKPLKVKREGFKKEIEGILISPNEVEVKL